MAAFANKFVTSKQDWETPASLFRPLFLEFGFTLDVCATPTNAKCSHYYTEEDNGLVQAWRGVCWMNPPFRALGVWVRKAYEESLLHNSTVVCLLPARTNTTWWHEYCCYGEIRFLRGRPKFVGAEHGLPQPLAIVIFRGRNPVCGAGFAQPSLFANVSS